MGGPGRAGLLTVPASFSPLTGCPGQRRPTRPRRPSGKCLSPVAGSPGAGGRRNAFPVFPSMSVMSFEAVARLSQPRFRHFFEEGPIGRRKNHLLLTVCIVRYFAWGSQTQGHWPWGQFPSRDPEAQGMQSQISTRVGRSVRCGVAHSGGWRSTTRKRHSPSPSFLPPGSRGSCRRSWLPWCSRGQGTCPAPFPMFLPTAPGRPPCPSEGCLPAPPTAALHGGGEGPGVSQPPLA